MAYFVLERIKSAKEKAQEQAVQAAKAMRIMMALHKEYYPKGIWRVYPFQMHDIRMSEYPWFEKICLNLEEGIKMSANSATTWVQERRLRPIYELLDAGCNKKVIQDVDRLLKKSPNFACAKVLKGLALIRQQKKDEAKALLDTVAAEVPTDDGTIQALSICYREIDRPDELCVLLEAACEREKSEELLTHCFMSQVRLSEYQKMHKTALQLYKLYNKTTYFAWAVSSLLFKHEAAVAMLRSDPISLELAERMMDKLVKELKSPLDDNLLDLYIRILTNKTKWQKIYDVLTSSGYPTSNWSNGDLHSSYVCALGKLDKIEELDEYLRGCYMKNRDEYDLLKQIIDIFGKVSFDKLMEFMDDLRDNHPNRAVALADLYFSFEYCEESVALGRFERDLQMAIKYGADKPSFFSDVGKYFKLIDVETQFRLVNSLVPIQEKGSIESNFNSIPKIIKDVNFEMIFKELISRDEEGTCRLRQANICFGKYLLCEEVQLSLRTEDNLRTKESDYHDQYIIIAATNLLEESYKSPILRDIPILEEYLESSKWTNIDDNELIALKKRVHSDENWTGFWNETKQNDSLSESFEQLSIDKEYSDAHLSGKEALITFAISVLEYGLVRSPYNYTMRILLSKAYGKLGAVLAAVKVMQGLDLKHVQWDTLGYLIMPQAFTSGTYPEAIRMGLAAQNMYMTYKRESMEHVIAAYKYGSFNKVGEFLAFRVQLLDSISCTALCANKELLDLMMASTPQDVLKASEPSVFDENSLHDHSASDNRDFSVLQYFDENVDLQAIKETTADTDYCMKMLRITLALLMAKIIRLHKGVDCLDILSFERLLDKYDARMTAWSSIYHPTKHKDVTNAPQFHGIYPPVYAQDFAMGTPLFIIQQIRCVVEMLKDMGSPSLKPLQAKFVETANKMLVRVQANYDAFIKDKGLSTIETCIHDFHIILESFSFSRIILEAAFLYAKNFYESRKSKGGQKEKTNSFHLFKKSASYSVRAVLEKYEELHGCLVDFINELKRRPIPSMKHAGDSMQSILDASFLVVALKWEFSSAQNNIRHSHVTQLEEMRRVSAMLIEYLRTNIDP